MLTILVLCNFISFNSAAQAITGITWSWEYPFSKDKLNSDTHFFPYYTTYANLSNYLDGHFFTVRASELILEMDHYWKTEADSNCSHCEHMKYSKSLRFGTSTLRWTTICKSDPSLCEWYYDENQTHNVMNLKQIFFDNETKVALIKDRNTRDYIIAVSCTVLMEIERNRTKDLENLVKSLVLHHKFEELGYFTVKRDLNFYLSNSFNYQRDRDCEKMTEKANFTIVYYVIVSLVLAIVLIKIVLASGKLIVRRS